MSDNLKTSTKAFSLFRNYISFAGAVIAAASLVSIFMLILIEITGSSENTYLDIFTYIILPSFLILGLGIIFVGMILERRRRRKQPDAQIAKFPKIDLND